MKTRKIVLSLEVNTTSEFQFEVAEKMLNSMAKVVEQHFEGSHKDNEVRYFVEEEKGE